MRLNQQSEPLNTSTYELPFLKSWIRPWTAQCNDGLKFAMLRTYSIYVPGYAKGLSARLAHAINPFNSSDQKNQTGMYIDHNICN